MAKKKPVRRATKAKPSRPRKDTGSGGEPGKAGANSDMDSAAGIFSPLMNAPNGPDTQTAADRLMKKARELGIIKPAEEESEVAKMERRIVEQERQIEELKRDLREANSSRPRFPDDMYEMAHFLRNTPSDWHLYTLVEMIVRHLLRLTRMEPQERQSGAWEALAHIARKFRISGKTSRAYAPEWLLKATKEPAFQTVWNKPSPKRTKGDMKGNETKNVISLFVDSAMLAYDKSIEWRSGMFGDEVCPSRRERYGKPDEYIKGFLPFAKERWENGSREGVEALLDHFTPDILKREPEIVHVHALRQKLPTLRSADRLYLVLHVLGGLSKTEIFSLRWEHVDFKKGFIHVPSPGAWKSGLQCVARITPEMGKWLLPQARRRGGVVTIYGKLRSNVGKDDCTPKRSFGLFKDEIEAKAREFLESWRGAYPP